MPDDTTTIGSDAVAFECRDGVSVAFQRNFEINPRTGDLLESHLAEIIANGTQPDFVWDLSGLQFLSSIGITVALTLSKHVSQHGGKLCIAGLRGQCLNVMQVVGLTRVFDLYPSVDAAIESLRIKRSGKSQIALERRTGGDERTGQDRRKAQLPFEGPDRRGGVDRRSMTQRRAAR